MANLGPGTTGIGAYIHVFQNVDRRARHGPRIKVFPGNPGSGNATLVVVPGAPGEKAGVRGLATVPGETLRRALAFAELNWQSLGRYWADPTVTIDELLAVLVPVP